MAYRDIAIDDDFRNDDSFGDGCPDGYDDDYLVLIEPFDLRSFFDTPIPLLRGQALFDDDIPF